MTAQNTKTIQYRLRNGQSVEVTINNDGVPGEKVSISDLAIEKTIMCHLGFTEEVSKKHGVAIWRTMDTGMRRFITARTPGMTMMDLMQIAPLFECEPLDVFSNPAICQQLYSEMKLAVNGILIATGERRNVPKQEYISRGYFTLKETVIDTSNGSRISFTTRITGKGQQWLMKRLLDTGVLVPVAATR